MIQVIFTAIESHQNQLILRRMLDVIVVLLSCAVLCCVGGSFVIVGASAFESSFSIKSTVILLFQMDRFCRMRKTTRAHNQSSGMERHQLNEMKIKKILNTTCEVSGKKSLHN